MAPVVLVSLVALRWAPRWSAPLAFAAAAHAQPRSLTDEQRDAFIRTVQEKYEVSPDTVLPILAKAKYQQSIIDAIKYYLQEPEEKLPANISDHGNSSSASCAILLDECNRKGMFKKGDILVFSAFGAGLLSGVAVLEW